jgi:hypothetical protein
LDWQWKCAKIVKKKVRGRSHFIASAIGLDLALFALTESEYLSVQFWVGLQEVYAIRGYFGEVFLDVFSGHGDLNVITALTMTVTSDEYNLTLVVSQAERPRTTISNFKLNRTRC